MKHCHLQMSLNVAAQLCFAVTNNKRTAEKLLSGLVRLKYWSSNTYSAKMLLLHTYIIYMYIHTCIRHPLLMLYQS